MLKTQDGPGLGFSPVLDPGAAVQFLGPVVPRLLGDEPVVLSDCIRIHAGLVLPPVPTLRSNAAVKNGVEAVDSLRSQVSCKTLDEHSLSCLGSRKSHLWMTFVNIKSLEVVLSLLLTVIDFPRRAAVAPVTAITPSPLNVIFGPTC